MIIALLTVYKRHQPAFLHTHPPANSEAAAPRWIRQDPLFNTWQASFNQQRLQLDDHLYTWVERHMAQFPA